MSAFFVASPVIDIAAAALIRHERRPTDPDALGRAFWSMNREALRQRYRLDATPEGREELAGYGATIAAYRFHRPVGPGPAVVCKQVDCLLYQCCEGTVPEQDPLFARLKAVALVLAAPFGGDRRHDHPDWRAAPWGMDAVVPA